MRSRRVVLIIDACRLKERGKKFVIGHGIYRNSVPCWAKVQATCIHSIEESTHLRGPLLVHHRPILSLSHLGIP